MATGVELATAWVRLVPSFDGVQGKVASEFGGAGKNAAKRFSGAFSPALGGLLAVAGGALLAREVKDFVTVGVKSLARIETINAQTANVIKSTGGAAKVSAKQVEDLAGALERTTGTEAEAVQEGANLLLTFKNIRNEAGEGNDIFDQTTKAMVDVSRAMGTDAAGSAIQLGKALNDPIAGIAALARVGITFTDEQKELIKSLVESGDLLSAQKIILEELNSQFGGSGASYAATYAGKIQLVGHEFGTLQEAVTGGIMPALGSFADLALDVLTRVNGSPSLGLFIEKVNSASGAIVGNVGVMLDIIGKLNAAPEGFTFGAFIDQMVAAFPALQGVSDVLEAVAPILPELADAFVLMAPALADALPGLAALVLELLPLIPVLAPPLITMLSGVAGIVTDSGPALGTFAGFIADIVANAAGFYAVMGDALAGLSDAQILANAASGKYGELQKNILGFLGAVDAWIGTAILNVGIWIATTAANVRGFINGIIANINRVRSALTIVGDVIGGPLGMILNLPPIPGLANGGTVTAAGSVLVGERGPELLRLPRGASVDPNIAGANFPESMMLVDADGSLLGRMRVEVGSFAASESRTLDAGYRTDY